ncbi:hypothetical protein [uncultured Gemmiger sp.]|nr:hypothetical protein [uncultured Gemmiger sp.]
MKQRKCSKKGWWQGTETAVDLMVHNQAVEFIHSATSGLSLLIKDVLV